MSAILSIFLIVIMGVVVLSFFVGAVFFIVDVIRFAPARNKIEMMSSRLQALLDADDNDVEEVDEKSDSDSAPAEHVSVFRRKLEEVIDNVD